MGVEERGKEGKVEAGEGESIGNTHLLVDGPMSTLVIPAAVVDHFAGPALEDTDLVDTTTSREAEGTGVRNFNNRKGRSSAH